MARLHLIAVASFALAAGSACNDSSTVRSGRVTAALETEYVTASADTYVRSGTPNQAAGSAEFLRLQASGEDAGDQLAAASLGPDYDSDVRGDVATGAFMGEGAAGGDVGRACMYGSATGFR